MSGDSEKIDTNLRAITDAGAAAESGVPCGAALVRFVDEAVEAGPGKPRGCSETEALSLAREKILEQLGADALVDTAAVVGQFQRMDRVASATGIPLDGPLEILTADLDDELGLDLNGAGTGIRGTQRLKRTMASTLRRATAIALTLTRRLRRLT